MLFLGETVRYYQGGCLILCAGIFHCGGGNTEEAFLLCVQGGFSQDFCCFVCIVGVSRRRRYPRIKGQKRFIWSDWCWVFLIRFWKKAVRYLSRETGPRPKLRKTSSFYHDYSSFVLGFRTEVFFFSPAPRKPGP